MGELGWLLLIVLVILFGKNIPFIANLESGLTNATPSPSTPSGSFSQPNAVPTPNGLPALTTQNQTSPPENQPAPWKTICNASPVGNPIGAATSPSVPFPVSGTLISSVMSQ